MCCHRGSCINHLIRNSFRENIQEQVAVGIPSRGLRNKADQDQDLVAAAVPHRIRCCQEIGSEGASVLLPRPRAHI